MNSTPSIPFTLILAFLALVALANLVFARHDEIAPRVRNLPIHVTVGVPSLPSRPGQPALFYVSGLQTPEEVAIWTYYLHSDWISYPMRDGIYQQSLPVAYVPVNSQPAQQLIGYDYRGRAIYQPLVLPPAQPAARTRPQFFHQR